MNQKTRVLAAKTGLTVLSCIFVAVGICLFLQSALGSDPISVLLDGVRRTTGITFGTAQFIYNLVFLSLALVFSRKYIMLGTVAGSLLTGPLINLFDPLVQSVVGQSPDLWTRYLMIAVGQVILCAGVGLNLATKFGFGALDSLVVTLCERYKLKYKNLKILSDLAHVVLGILLGGVFGIGSILGVALGGPFIAFFMKSMNETLIRWLRLNEYAI